MTAGAFVRGLPAELAQLPSVRAELRAQLAKWDIPQPVRDAAVLAATELCTEALERAQGQGVTLRAWATDSSLEIEVTAPEGGEPPVEVARLRRCADESLRAGILRRVCDRMAVTTRERRRIVQCGMGIAGPVREAPAPTSRAGA